ncbi:MAG: adenylate/guanylate cyclase domain-containing protein, partial [Gaiellaceae bacterium]
MLICEKCGVENPPQARFCLGCGSPLTDTAPAPAEERKIVTAIFVDLVGSTARSEQLDPEDVKALVSPYHARVRAELEGHGGTFEKFSGDAVLALFGSPVAHEDDPERAVRAALAVRQALEELNAEDEWLDLHFRVGINTGEALVMLDARPTEGEWSAAGDVMNTAARIQSAAPVDGVLVGEQTYRATRHAFEFRPADPVEAKGKSEPVQVWEVVGARDGAGPRQLTELGLIGREAELEELLRFCEEMLEQRRPAVATVIGAPGIGKTRLLAELTQRLRERCDVHFGRCLSYGEGITYWPVEEILKDAAGILHDDDGATASTKLGTLLESLGTTDQDELRTIAAAVANLIGAETTPQGTYSTAEITQAELHWGLRRLLELLAARRPMVVVLEDLHWAEPTLLELVGLVAESAAEAPLLVLGSARPEAKETRSLLFRSDGNRRALELDALTDEASSSLVSAVAGQAGLSTEVVEAVLRQAGGNPLFIEETVRMLAEGGGVRDEEGGLAVPDSLQALIASRLDQLQLPAKRLAHNASVIGLAFWPGALAHLSGSEADLEGGLDSLERRDLIRRNRASSMARELEYVFKHIMIRDVAYGQLTKSRRSALHARFAEWLSALTVAEDELVEFVAYHLEQACLIAQTIARPAEPPPVDAAVEALVRAAEKAERREGTAEADRFYERALEIAGDDRPEAAVDLRLRRCRILFAQGEFPRAQEQLGNVAEDAGRLGRLDVRCGALVILANIAQIQGRPAESRRVLAEAEPLAAEIDDQRLQIRAAYTSAYIRGWVEGEVGVAVEALRGALAIA